MNVAEVTTVILSRLHGLLHEAEIVDINPAISWAVREAGGTVASVITATDAEVNAVADEDFLLDLTEYRCVIDIIGNLALVDIKEGPMSEKYGQLTDFALRLKENLANRLRMLYGYGAATLEVAKITYPFAEHLTT